MMHRYLSPGTEAFTVISSEVGKTGKRSKVEGFSRVRVLSNDGDIHRVETIKGHMSSVPLDIDRADLYVEADAAENDYFGLLVCWFTPADGDHPEHPGLRPDLPDGIFSLDGSFASPASSFKSKSKIERKSQVQADVSRDQRDLFGELDETAKTRGES